MWWKQAASTLSPSKPLIKLEKWPIMPKSHTTAKDKDQLKAMEQEMKQKFGTVCKPYCVQVLLFQLVPIFQFGTN